MIQKLIFLLSIILANQLSASAQQIPSGRYVDLSGSEDFYVVVVNGRVSSTQCVPGRGCPPVSQFQILNFNSSIPAITVKHQNWTHEMCLESTAPSWANKVRVAYCSFDKGWTIYMDKDRQMTF